MRFVTNNGKEPRYMKIDDNQNGNTIFFKNLSLQRLRF